MTLTPRDLEIILFVHRLEGCVTDHVRQRFFPATARTTVHLRLAQLIRATYLVSRRLPPNGQGGSGPAWLTVGPAALPLIDRYFGLSMSEKKHLRHTFILPHWQHEVELRSVRVHLEMAVSRSGIVTLDDWLSERILRQQAFELTDLVTNSPIRLIPDGQFTLLFGDGPSHHFFVELDRGSAASRQRYLPKLRAYLQRADSTTVLFIVPAAARAAQLSRWIQYAAHQLDMDPAPFLITTKNLLGPKSILAAPIWQAADQSTQALLDRLVSTHSQPTSTPHAIPKRPSPDDWNLQ